MKWIFTSNVADHSLDIVEYVLGFIHRSETNVRGKLAKRLE